MKRTSFFREFSILKNKIMEFLNEKQKNFIEKDYGIIIKR